MGEIESLKLKKICSSTINERRERYVPLRSFAERFDNQA
jgi:hypothetical protein